MENQANMQGAAEGRQQDLWRMGFHLMPPIGLMGAPRLLCQDADGLYHLFFEYQPDWPRTSKQGWGHYTSHNLALWDFLGMASLDDIPEGAKPCHISGLATPAGASDASSTHRCQALDQGFGFSDPTACVNHDGRAICIGLLSGTEARGRRWAHCLTVPREVTRAEDGATIQQPVGELDLLHTYKAPISGRTGAMFDEHRADIQLSGISGTHARLRLDAEAEFLWEDGVAHARFLEPIQPGCPAGELRLPLERLTDLRLLVDSSALELYLNGGRTVISTRWFPRTRSMICYLDMDCEDARAWAMADGMDGTYPA